MAAGRDEYPRGGAHARRTAGYPKVMTQVNPIQLQKFLRGVDYPARKEDLVAHARGRGADEEVLQTLEQLPMANFNSPNDVSEAVGKSR